MGYDKGGSDIDNGFIIRFLRTSYTYIHTEAIRNIEKYRFPLPLARARMFTISGTMYMSYEKRHHRGVCFHRGRLKNFSPTAYRAMSACLLFVN